jgi:hypothetical protein
MDWRVQRRRHQSNPRKRDGQIKQSNSVLYDRSCKKDGKRRNQAAALYCGCRGAWRHSGLSVGASTPRRLRSTCTAMRHVPRGFGNSGANWRKSCQREPPPNRALHIRGSDGIYRPGVRSMTWTPDGGSNENVSAGGSRFNLALRKDISVRFPNRSIRPVEAISPLCGFVRKVKYS